MRIRPRLIFGIAVLATVLISNGCMSKEVIETRQMTINSIDISTVKDGNYNGDYTYGNFTYVVSVQVKGRKIMDIKIIKNRTTKQAIMAEGVVERIVTQQRNDVDAISGATTTSKAFLKAIENALAKGL